MFLPRMPAAPHLQGTLIKNKLCFCQPVPDPPRSAYRERERRARAGLKQDVGMAIVSSGALVDLLRQHQLLSAQQLHEVFRLVPGRCADVRILAKALIYKGWFTVYQINQILAGHGKDLVLGPYQILDRLGRGGQSEVYKARHPEYDWTVALKIVRAQNLAYAEVAEQFLLEMQAMAELEHPNIVQFWDADKAGDVYYCAMEFVDGTDLGKVVRLQNYLPVAEAAEYVRQTALGLQHAHEHNLVHRDVKPLNLFLTREIIEEVDSAGRLVKRHGPPLIKILDWGLASLRPCLEADAEAGRNGLAHTIIGTADYLSPEQALNPRGVDIRGDIYSLGCTLYYLLTGRTPFDGTTVMQKVLQHQNAEPPPVDCLMPEVPPAVAAIVRRMMAKKPEDRFQTPAAVALGLKPYCRAESTTSRRREPPKPCPAPPLQDTPALSGTLGVNNRANSGR
jgi:serine/threonine-protein kinase